MTRAGLALSVIQGLATKSGSVQTRNQYSHALEAAVSGTLLVVMRNFFH